MFEDRRKLIIAALITLLIVIAALILWWLFGPKASTPTVVAPPTQPETSNQALTPAALPPATPQRLEEDKNYPLGLKQLAMAFAERFGSYSTDEPTKNLADLDPLMTAGMKSSLVQAANSEPPVIFSGFSTKALSSNLIKSDANSAVVVVKTQRTQTLGDGAAVKTFYADLELRAVKSGGSWLIDSARWQ